MARTMTGIHKGGRPEKYDKQFYVSLLDEYENNTYKMLSEKYHVSRATIAHWLKKGRKLNEQTKSE